MNDGVRVTITDSIMDVLIDRPEKHNALTFSMRADLASAFRSAGSDSSVRAVILRGAGRSFCAGQDLHEIQSGEMTARATLYSRDQENLATIVSQCSVPTVAVLHGNVLGRGLELALAADIRIAAEDLRMGFPELAHGMVVGGGGARRLTRMVGESRAMSMLLCGTFLDAATSFDWGLVTKVVPVNEMDSEARAVAQSLTSVPEMILYAAKTSVRHAFDVPATEGAWTDSLINVLTKSQAPVAGSL